MFSVAGGHERNARPEGHACTRNGVTTSAERLVLAHSGCRLQERRRQCRLHDIPQPVASLDCFVLGDA